MMVCLHCWKITSANTADNKSECGSRIWRDSLCLQFQYSSSSVLGLYFTSSLSAMAYWTTCLD